MKELIRTIKAALPFKTDLLDKGIVEIYEENIGTHSLILGISFETHPEHNVPVYIFNLFADEEYVNIEGEYEENEIGQEVFVVIAKKWEEWEELCRKFGN